MRITSQLLARRNACDEMREVFRSQWPNGVDVTPENLAIAQSIGLPLTWFDNLFEGKDIERFWDLKDKVDLQWEEAIRPPRKAWYDAHDKLVDEEPDLGWQERDEKLRPHKEAYLKARDAADEQLMQGMIDTVMVVVNGIDNRKAQWAERNAAPIPARIPALPGEVIFDTVIGQ